MVQMETVQMKTTYTPDFMGNQQMMLYLQYLVQGFMFINVRVADPI